MNFRCTVLLVFSLIAPFVKADVLFIGHGYGNHGGKIIPYPPLEALLKSNTLPSIRIWGGDLTEDQSRFPEFQKYIGDIGGVNLLVRGNHDGKLWTKTPYWSDYVTSDNVWIHNFDLEGDMKFAVLPAKPNVVASHYVWFNQVFSPLNFPNWMMNAEFIDLKKLRFDSGSHLFIAGDCGAFSAHSGGFARTFIGKNQFVCSGMGGGIGVNNVVVIGRENITYPIFFDVNGRVVPHICKKVKSDSGFDNAIDVCGTAEYMSKKYL